MDTYIDHFISYGHHRNPSQEGFLDTSPFLASPFSDQSNNPPIFFTYPPKSPFILSSPFHTSQKVVNAQNDQFIIQQNHSLQSSKNKKRKMDKNPEEALNLDKLYIPPPLQEQFGVKLNSQSKKIIKPEKYAKSTESNDSEELKKQSLLLRNRMSAQSSREKKKFYIQQLEEENSVLKQENVLLLGRIEKLESDYMHILKENQMIKNNASYICYNCGCTGGFENNTESEIVEPPLDDSETSSPLIQRAACRNTTTECSSISTAQSREDVNFNISEDLLSSDSSLNPENSPLQGVPTNSKLHKTLTELIARNKEFKDPNFPTDLNSIFTGATHKHLHYYQTAVWKRPHQFFQCEYDKIAVFEDKIGSDDVLQGLLGVCYFLASLSALAEFPPRLTKIFLNKATNRYGIYGLQFYIRGVPTEIIIDDWIPCYGDQTNANSPLFSRPKGKELWVLLAEKAWAKRFGSYVACELGSPDEALEDLTGVPTAKYFTAHQSQEEIFQVISESIRAKHIICAATHDGDRIGLLGHHAYSIISVHNVGEYKLLKLRNPWGYGEWKGDFSDDSDLWPEEIKRQVGNTETDDGVFYMTVKDFKEHCICYYIAYYNEGWEYTYFEAESERNHAEYFGFTIDRPCEVYFRIHQEDKKSLSKEKQSCLEYASGHLVIVRVQDDKSYQPIVKTQKERDRSAIYGNRTIFPSKHKKIQLPSAGKYIIMTKMKWKEDQRRKFTLSAYSPDRIELKKLKPVKGFMAQITRKIHSSEENKELNQCKMLSNTGITTSSTKILKEKT